MEPAGQTQRRLALLIDCDNVSISDVESVIEEATQEGIVTIRRGYADWTTPQINKAWTSANMDKHAIMAVQQFRIKGKNSSDVALVIDAMDILHSNAVEGFCIYSSDGDYTRLVRRIREAGKYAIGFGAKKATANLVNAFDRFVFIENLRPAKATTQPKKQALSDQQMKELKRALERAMGSDSDTIDLAALGNRLLKNNPAFDYREYGFKSLSGLVQGFVAQDKNAWSFTREGIRRYLNRK